MKDIILKTIEKSRTKMVVYLIISVVFMWMYVALYPTLSGEGETFRELLDSYPEAMVKAFGINKDLLFSNLEATLGMYHFSVIFPFIFIAFVVTQAAGIISGEIEDKSMSVYLALPLSRIKIFVSKYFAGLVIFFVYLLISVFSVVPFALLHEVEYVFQNYLNIFFLCFMFGLTVYSMTFMFSCLFSSSGRTNGVVGGIIFSMYSVFLFAALNEAVEFLGNLSFFNFYDYESALVRGDFDLQSILIFLISSIIFTIIAMFWFNKRDIVV